MTSNDQVEAAKQSLTRAESALADAERRVEEASAVSIAARRDRAATELETARRTLAEAERAAKVTELLDLDKQVTEQEAALAAVVVTLERTLASRIASLREACARASALRVELGGAPGLGVAASPWLAATPPLQIAARLAAASPSHPSIAPPPWDDPNSHPDSWSWKQ
jgi:hypothetical protein